MPECAHEHGSRLALGTVQFGLRYGIANQHGEVSDSEMTAILAYARAHAVDTLDTAIAYGDSERRLGEAGIEGWRVVSKLPAVPEGCADVAQWAKASAEESRQRLRVASLHGLLLHRPQQLLERGGEDLYRALIELKQQGLVSKIGVSIYDPSELDALAANYTFDLVQAPFNILDRRLIDTGWLSRLHERGIEVHVRSVFLQGLLLMAPQARPPRFARWQALWRQWDGWLAQTRLTPLQACLRHALDFAQIENVVVGVDTLSQLTEILQALDGPAPQVPRDLHTADPDLINPARWAALA
jgi:aryl-alcohol dehydrogenase-like predicted oxidoreductase